MEEIDKKLNNLSFIEVPFGLHQSVMKKVSYQKNKPVFFVAFILFAFNFLLIAWHINAKLIDADFVTMTRDFLEVFDFSFSFIGTVFVSFFEIISPILILSAIFSLTGVVYIGKRINFYQLSGI